MSESEQNLAGQQIHEEKLRRYLLGQCSADESAEIERAAFQDSSVSDALSVIEDELTEDYVCDQLNDLDRSCFELKFLTSGERREKLRLSALLLNRTEVLRSVPPSFVRAHQLMSQEMKDVFWRGRELRPDASQVRYPDVLEERMPASIPIELGSAASRWKRWIVLVAVPVVLVLILYGIRVRLSTPVNTPPPVLNPTPAVLNPTPAITSVFLTEPLRAYPPPESLESRVLIVKGEHFTEGATVQWNGSNRETEFVDSTTLLTRFLKRDLAIASTAEIRIVVVNPPPGGGPSPPFILSPAPKK